MNKNLIITIVLIIVVGAGAFFGGMKYQQGKSAGQFRQFSGGVNGGRTGLAGRGSNGSNASGFRPVDGQIISSDNNSITVKLSDGSSKIIILSDNTVINQSSQATKADLKTGETVAVFGQQNSDGSVTAQNIQLNPISRGGLTPTPGQ